MGSIFLISDLPEEMLMKIFLKLSVNSVLRCRCVCKQWREFLSDSEFIELHLNHSPSSYKILLRPYKCSHPFYIVDYQESKKGNKCLNTPDLLLRRDLPLETRCFPAILGSCNGLVSVSINQGRLNNPNYDKIVLWNPSTREYKILPDASPKIETTYTMFDLLMLLGFGYDYFSRDYKFVRVFYKQVEWQVDVYSLKKDSWKVFKCTRIQRFIYTCNEAGVAVNGCIYWPMCSDIPGRFTHILSFDLKDENFCGFEIPNKYEHVHGLVCNNIYLKEIGGFLGVICYYCEPATNNADFVHVWRMVKCGDKLEWDELMFMSCYQIGIIDHRYFAQGYPICHFEEKGKITFFVSHFHHKCKMERMVFVSYDSKLKKPVRSVWFDVNNCKESDLKGEIVKNSNSFYSRSFMYKESLVSPNA